jgi:hypothetical protein
VTDDHPPAGVIGVVAQLGEQPGLAYAGIAREQDGTTDAMGRAPVCLPGGRPDEPDQLGKPVKLVRAPDEWAMRGALRRHATHHRG